MGTGRLSSLLLWAVAFSITVVAAPAALAHCLDNVLPAVHTATSRVLPNAAGSCTAERLHDAPPTHLNVNTNVADAARTRIDTPHAETMQLATNRWIVTGGGAGAQGPRDSSDTEYESAVSRSMNQLPFVDSRDWIHNPPEILQEVRNYRRQGMPIIHLMQSKETTVMIGVSNHGKPGLYFTRRLPF